MQVTLGEEGSGLSNPQPLFLPVTGNIAGDAPPLMLRLLLSLRLRLRLSEVERAMGGGGGGSREYVARPGLRIDLDEIFMEDDEVVVYWWLWAVMLVAEDE
ncbi:hypothetical protein HanRHA438_Chr15g0729301 [Helianthus annuus]|uniref:Uncharacterized protein n=1 Tax=Helianthus annuus TaxID=4232 RepID=A0A9K3E483_HELAN|nr:hypothetical protein HanXRQr2_Chr15g0717171 [Helianthus annuus]KAJ0458008.1 hypothetical protein HanIR_Chr15g0780271 [Helianthus annuus]KAJ0833246.1 hypothetical protein HanPSC8_Chr15g0688131 [Helianthus annuus]KAJ0846825.1 hypothetical protein HanRHA438_Chr15g0729301 [Helianthus annuus]